MTVSDEFVVLELDAGVRLDAALDALGEVVEEPVPLGVALGVDAEGVLATALEGVLVTVLEVFVVGFVAAAELVGLEELDVGFPELGGLLELTPMQGSVLEKSENQAKRTENLELHRPNCANEVQGHCATPPSWIFPQVSAAVAIELLVQSSSN